MGEKTKTKHIQPRNAYKVASKYSSNKDLTFSGRKADLKT